MAVLSSRRTSWSTRRRDSTGGRGERPAKYMLYSASSRRSSDSSSARSRSTSGASGTRPKDEKPHERQPQLAGVWKGPIVDEDVTRVETPHYLKEIAQRGGIGGVETRAVAERFATADFAVFSRA